MPKTEIQTVLDRLTTRNERVLRVPLQIWMDVAQKQIRKDLRDKYIKKDITTELTDWNFIEDQGKRTLKPAALKVMQTGGNVAYKQLAITGSFDVLNVHAVRAADKFCAKLVTNVTQKTKEGVRTFVSAGIKEGKQMGKIARELRPLVGLTKPQTQAVMNYRKLLTEKRPDLSAAQIDKNVMAYTNKTHRRRMENIARTETARAQNVGYCQGLAEVGVAEAEFAIAPTDYCEECEALNGTRYPVAEAGEIIPVHPLCRCAMLPVVGEETIDGMLDSPPPELPGILASEEGKMSWPKYRTLHQGEKTNTALLYDYYKIQYETTGRMAEGTKKFLRAKAPKFEATSIKISKPIPGLEDIIKPVKIPVGAKPVKIPTPEPVTKPPKGVLPKSYYNTVDDWDKRLAKHKASLRERLGFDIEALKMQRTDLPEYKEALAKFEKAVKSYTRPTANFGKARTGLNLQGEYARFEGKAKLNVFKFYGKMEEMACNGLIKEYGSRNVSAYIYQDRIVGRTYTRYRANAEIRAFTINMSQSNNVGVYFHELGHLIERNYATKTKAFRWVSRRGGGRHMPYAKVCSWSKDPQNAFKNKFISPYVGKYYRDKSTEVLSMGLQQFTSYKQMMRFAKKDFDHFAFVHGILTGAI